MPDAPFVISSTTLSTFLDCPKKWHFQYIDGRPIQPNYAMAVGTLTHAVLEFKIQRGFWPPRTQIRRMEGAYDDPIEAMKAFPGAFEEAMDLARSVDLDAFFPDGTAHMEVEVPLEDFGLSILGVPCTGFFDLLDRENKTIRDWKTRGRFDYAPRTAGDFHDNTQLSYYAAACRQALGWDAVTVQHINLLRPSKGGPETWPVEARLDGWYLDRVWEKLEDEIVPQMLEVAETGKAPRNEKACYQYGPCPHLEYCDVDGADDMDFFALIEARYDEEQRMNLLSPQTPPDIEPVPFEEKTVDELGFDSRQCANLAAAGIRTLEDMVDFLEDGGDLTDISYIGEKSVPPALEILESMKAGAK